MQYNIIKENYFINENSPTYDNFLLKPKNDFVFKRIFGDSNNKDLLISLLNSILNEELKDVTILNSELLPENIEDKKGILDVRVVTDKGYHIDIEIQVLRTAYMPQRSLFYWSKLYIEQIISGDKYDKLRKTITINILDFNTLESSKYHNIFHLREDYNGIMLTDVMEIHFIELNKLFNSDESNTKLIQWLNFIKGDSKEVIEEMAKVNPDIEKAFDILMTLSQDKKARALYLSREMALHDEATRMHEAIEEGLRRGKTEGREQGLVEGRAEGKAEGRAEGRTEVLIEQLSAKFNGLPKDIEVGIRELPEDKLRILALKIFQLSKLDDIYTYLQGNL